MFIPSLNNDIGILVYYNLYFVEVASFDVLFLDNNKFISIPLKLSHSTISLNVNVWWLVFFTVKEE